MNQCAFSNTVRTLCPATIHNKKDLAENEDLCVKPLIFHRPRTTSTYGSAESIATPPPDSDFDDEQIRALLASPLYLQEREKQVRTDHKFITL